jgi:hypothetical protein
MRTSHVRSALWLFTAALALAPTRPQAAPDTVVVEIKADRLEPRVVQATTGAMRGRRAITWGIS